MIQFLRICYPFTLATTNFMLFLHKIKSQYLWLIILLNQEDYLENKYMYDMLKYHSENIINNKLYIITV